jgi:GNAT superfamily N-acetyltransferase
VDAAAGLLADRHRRHRLDWPALNPAYQEAGGVRPLIAALLEREGSSGSIVLADGRAVAYVVGAPRDAKWGANVWVEDAGSSGTDAEAIRVAYADAAARWVDAGQTHHYAVIPASDAPSVDAWFRLSFGIQHIHALRELPPADFAVRAGSLVVRPAETRDVDAIVALEPILPTHSGQSPVFSSVVSRMTPEEARAEVEEELADARTATYVAELEGRVVGTATYCALEISDGNTPLMRPVSAGFLAYAAVPPDARGLGVGRALADACLVWARDSGYEWVAVDWRSTNLEADRTWRAAGFRPTFYRLFRRIG